MSPWACCIDMSELFYCLEQAPMIPGCCQSEHFPSLWTRSETLSTMAGEREEKSCGVSTRACHHDDANLMLYMVRAYFTPVQRRLCTNWNKLENQRFSV
mmetsp:Transcript_19426/g.45524  ORF Transcript_19426/g.45524 Transcript_19426/m.45524 type:complete len:99 (-) Transcript_19426:120-416(-)